MKRVSFTKCLVSVFLVASMMFLSGCGNSCTCDDDDNNGSESGGRKELFEIYILRDTKNGTYMFNFEPENRIYYPIPKFLINGVEVKYDYEGPAHPEFVVAIPSGNLTYSIIWDGDTLTRTLNLPSNTYSLVEDSTETQYRYKVTGGNGDEKVLWRAYNSGDGSIRDTLQTNREFVFPKDYRLSSCNVMHKDFKLLTFGYSAIAESKKIAVCEYIRLWIFND